MNERIAIVGGSVRAAAMSAVRAGFQPVAADRFGDVDLRRIAPATRIDNYPDGLLAWLRELRPTPAAWIYTGGLENHPDLVDAMAAVCPLWGNQGDVLRQVRSPWRLAEILKESRLLFPETRSTLDGLPRDGSWLAKTYCGAGGIGVSVLTEIRRSEPSALLAPSLPRSLSPCLFQRRVAGNPSAAVFAAGGRNATLLGVVRQLVGEEWLGAREFQYCGAIGPYPCTEAVLAEIQRIGCTIAERFGLAGLFGVDLMIDREQVWVVEVNPRYAASVEVVERSTGVDAIGVHFNACTGQQLPPTNKTTLTRCGKAILFAKDSVSVTAEFVEWADRQNHDDVWPNVADISPAGTSIEAGQPVMTVFATGLAAGVVEKVLRLRVAEIESRLYSYWPVGK